MLLTPGEIVALPVGVWRQVDPLPVVEERNDAEVRRAGDSTLKMGGVLAVFRCLMSLEKLP